MTATVDSIENTLRAQLLSARHSEGGWGYEPGCVPRLEPTCWALLALRASRSVSDKVLALWPATGGALVEQRGGLVNWSFHALALSTRIALGEAFVSELKSLANALVDGCGSASHQPAAQCTDGGLHGWSWIDGTFSWVEPMSWALLALKRCRVRGLVNTNIEARIREGEAILEQRVCATGGWNYGYSPAFGNELPGHVPTTAIVLLALQDRGDELFIRQSCGYLEQHAENHPSTRGLALSILALKRHGCSTGRVEARLHRWLDEHPTSDAASIGMALSALHRAGADAFVL